MVHKRLGDGEAVMPDALGSSDGVQSGMSVDDDTEFDRAAKMWADGKLDEAEVINTINEGQKKLAMAMIAVMSDLSLRIVERTCAAKKCKRLSSHFLAGEPFSKHGRDRARTIGRHLSG